MNKGHKFCVVFGTKNYYDMFREYIYKYSKSDWNEIIVLNVDIDSDPDQKKRGQKICEELGIHFVNPNKNYTSWQQSIPAAEEYLTEQGIDVDWIMSCQHDVVPVIDDYWDRIDDNLDYIEKYKDKIAMFGGTTYQYVGYDEACKLATHPDLVTRRRTGTSTGRGCLESGLLDEGCWYKNLPEDYYRQKYFVVESPTWCFVGFNRKLFKEHIQPDTDMYFELWPDDIAHQFLKKNYINVSFPDLLACTDHSLKPASCTSIARNSNKDFCREHLKFIEKHGWRWGYRQYSDPRFSDVINQYENTMQEKLYHNKISDGPKSVEDYTNVQHVNLEDIFYSFDDIKNILLSDPEVKGDYIFDDNFFSQIENIFDSDFNYDFKNKTCAIVGNSPILLDTEFGKQIDDYDVVIRCNHGPIEGYEKHVGSNTNFRIVSSKVFGYDEITSLSKFDHNYLSDLDNQHFILKLPLNRFPNHALHGFQKNFGGTNKVSIMKDSFQQTIKQSVGGDEPSTGIFALILFLCFFEKIDMYGFDFYSGRGKTNKLHYFEEVNHYPGSHNFDQERDIVESLIDANRVAIY
jgi:hypothetical protein